MLMYCLYPLLPYGGVEPLHIEAWHPFRGVQSKPVLGSRADESAQSEPSYMYGFEIKILECASVQYRACSVCNYPRVNSLEKMAERDSTVLFEFKGL